MCGARRLIQAHARGFLPARRRPVVGHLANEGFGVLVDDKVDVGSKEQMPRHAWRQRVGGDLIRLDRCFASAGQDGLGDFRVFIAIR